MSFSLSFPSGGNLSNIFPEKKNRNQNIDKLSPIRIVVTIAKGGIDRNVFPITEDTTLRDVIVRKNLRNPFTTTVAFAFSEKSLATKP